MKKNILIILLILIAGQASAHPAKDEIHFGNAKSENKHSLVSNKTETYKGGLNETARRLLPLEPTTWYGGTMSFKMKVDSEKQNYFTVRCYGSETDRNVIMLFINGLQVGYRHLGDIDYLHIGNQDAPFLNRFYYVTLPLPLSHTKGKKEVSLEIRSYGAIWGYGDTFEKYQKEMVEPTIGFYKAYTHTQTCYNPDKKEAQGEVPVYKTRTSPGVEILGELKKRVNADLNNILAKDVLDSQLEMWTLAEASTVNWTIAYQNKKVVQLIIASIDSFYKRYQQQTNLVYQDPSVYNNEWLIIGPMCRAIRMLWNEIHPFITSERRIEWSEMMQAALEYSTNHRRHYTNQSMIIDLFMYDVNKTLGLIEPLKALPEYQTLKYLHESVGLTPWTGVNNTCPLGDNYWQLTRKGLTKELGYVGNYGEVLDWVNDIYRSTCMPGQPETGDPQIRAQLLCMMEARSYFRHPGVDREGNAVMRMEAVVGWRDGGHYPGDIVYGDRGAAWDATPLMTAAATLDSRAIGMAQQMMKDNQFFSMVAQKLETKNMRGTRSLLHIPDEYELIIKQPQSDFKMPMAPRGPDFVFSDEEDGVVAIKNSDEILYVSLYWRARFGVNNLAKVHYTTPIIDRVANVHIKTIIDDSGMRYERPNWVNLAFWGTHEWYEGVESAHTGEELLIARIPEGVQFKPGDENIYAGKALFYQLDYGKYIIGMNSSPNQTFELKIHPESRKVKNLTNNSEMVKTDHVKVHPMSTVVLYAE